MPDWFLWAIVAARDNFGRFNPNKRHDPAEWPEDLRVQEFPEVRDAAL